MAQHDSAAVNLPNVCVWKVAVRWPVRVMFPGRGKVGWFMSAAGVRGQLDYLALPVGAGVAFFSQEQQQLGSVTLR